ncbi:MAG: HPr family phosphocarrier protein [Candidatus Omnitrophota bacterium]
MLVEKKIVIKNKSGLHARPAALFVQIANRYNSDVTVRKGKLEVNGKSIMGILMLAAEKGSTITLKVEGEDAEKTILELEKLLSGDMEMPVLEKKR